MRCLPRLGAAVITATALGIAAEAPQAGAGPHQAPADPTKTVPPGPGISPNQSSINAQIQTARSRFAATSREPHAGGPEVLVHPQLDRSGSGLSSPPGTQSPATNSSVAPSTTSGSLPGLDVSSYQGNVDWAQVQANGAKFAYVKATEGTYYTNPYFPQQYTGSYNAGLVRGVYHFAIPNNSSGAGRQTSLPATEEHGQRTTRPCPVLSTSSTTRMARSATASVDPRWCPGSAPS
jgi:hypothetical protein